MKRKRTRRGAAVVLAVIVLAALNLVIVGSLAASAEESRVGAFRVDSVRAFYAAESGSMIAARLLGSAIELPDLNTPVPVGPANFTLTEAPELNTAGTVRIIGRAGDASRRIRLTIDESQ